MSNKKFGGMAAAVLLTAAVFAASGMKRGAGEPEYTETKEEDTENEGTAAAETEPLPVYSAEEELLHALYTAMEKNDLSAAAEMIDENQEQLKILLEKTLSGKKYLYYETSDRGTAVRHMKELDENTEGRGLVVARFNTVFFGEFYEGKPEGECTALQTMILTYLRYTFAEGIWKGGKMNGPGRTGYRYCGEIPEGSFAMTKKEGNYAENLMEGTFTYQAAGEDGAVLHWNMEAKAGVTVLGDQWMYDAYSKEYKLFSEKDPARAYVLSEEKAGMILWNNLILWSD